MKEYIFFLHQDNASFHPFGSVFLSVKLMSTSAIVQACQKVQRRWTKWQFENWKKNIHIYTTTWGGAIHGSWNTWQLATFIWHIFPFEEERIQHGVFQICQQEARCMRIENQSTKQSIYTPACLELLNHTFLKIITSWELFSRCRSIFKTLDIVKVYQVFYNGNLNS